MCKQESSPNESTIYIYQKRASYDVNNNIWFSYRLYIQSIQILAFRLPLEYILGTNNCGEMIRTAFKPREIFQDVICRSDYADSLFVRFAHQVQSKYYGINRYMYIEGILFEHFSAVPKTDINTTTPSRQRHALFHYFYLMIAKNMLLLLLHTASI